MNEENMKNCLVKIRDAISEYLVSEAEGFQTAERRQVELPSFDKNDLINHKWKRGRKRTDGTYAEGSLDKGWDFTAGLNGTLNFKTSTIDALKDGPQLIGRYEFTLSENGRFVNVEKVT